MSKTALNERGQEVLDPTPMAIPFGYQRPPTLQEQVMRLMRVQYDMLQDDGLETPEEADDFDVGDDFDVDPVSGHEFVDSEPGQDLPSGNLKQDFDPEPAPEPAPDPNPTVPTDTPEATPKGANSGASSA